MASIDVIQSVSAATPEALVTITVMKAFLFTFADHSQFEFTPGKWEVPESVAENQFVKAHGPFPPTVHDPHQIYNRRSHPLIKPVSEEAKEAVAAPVPGALQDPLTETVEDAPQVDVFKMTKDDDLLNKQPPFTAEEDEPEAKRKKK